MNFLGKKHQDKGLKKSILILKTFILCIFGLVFFSLVQADFSSNNFRLENPSNIIEGGQSSSASFQYISSTGQLTSGQSTSSTFVQNGGSIIVNTTPIPPIVPIVNGGGGGGATINPYPPNLILMGRAYPLNKVVVLKDGQIIVATIAGPDGRFEVSLSNLVSGNYNFSLYGEDKLGLRSSFFTFPLYISSGVTTKVSGIFIAPTLAIDKVEVRRGDTLTIFGQSASQAEVTIAINSDNNFFIRTVSDKDGVYLGNFDTSPLAFGEHSTKVKAAIATEISPFSNTLAFLVGTKNTHSPSTQELKGDFNKDGRVNIIDFSIIAYWYKRPNPPAEVDLNKDGQVDLTDISILVYYWTG